MCCGIKVKYFFAFVFVNLRYLCTTLARDAGGSAYVGHCRLKGCAGSFGDDVMENLQRELAKLCEAIEKNVVKKPMRALALDKLGGYLRGMEKPSRETLDRLSLLAGFQSWESFRDALHGDADGSTNYRGGKTQA